RSPSCLPCFSSSTMLGLPAAATNVGNQSSPENNPFSTLPEGAFPGQRTMQGTRKPPSITVPLPPANGVWPPSGQVKFSVPLSVVKTTMVSCSSPSSLSFFMTAPTMSSSWAIPASWMVQPFSGVRSFSYFSERWVTTCIRVGFNQRKNGLPSLLALSRNLSECSRISSSTVFMRSGYSVPASSIRCLPTLPQRGCSVGSSTSVAQVCSMFLGPTLSFSSGG